jgi:hypothetical protein
MRANRAAVELNVALAAKYHGQAAEWRALASAIAALTPADWRRLVRDSRIWQRATARLRAGFAAHGNRADYHRRATRPRVPPPPSAAPDLAESIQPLAADR